MQNNLQLVENLVRLGVLQDKALIRAFNKIDRADFVGKKNKRVAYLDVALSIGQEQTISQPSTVAIMLEALNPEPGNKILDLGSGSGWTTALLAYVVGYKGSVIGVERITELVTFGTKNLSKYNLKNVKIVTAEKNLGYLKKAPYDRILVSAQTNLIPEELLNQLAPHGKMIIPINERLISVVNRFENKFEMEVIPDYRFLFVPLVTE